MAEQLFDRKGIPAGHADDTCIAQLNFIQLVLKLALLVVPEDDAALVVVREGGSKALVQIEEYFFGVHAFIVPVRVSVYNSVHQL